MSPAKVLGSRERPFIVDEGDSLIITEQDKDHLRKICTIHGVKAGFRTEGFLGHDHICFRTPSDENANIISILLPDGTIVTPITESEAQAIRVSGRERK